MIYAYYDTESDCIAAVNIEPEGEVTFSFPDDTDINRLYHKDSEIRVREAIPSPYHAWDNDAEAWVDQSASVLPTIKAKALATIAEGTSAARERYVTPITSQSTVLDLKRQQASAYLAELASGMEPQASDYPLVFAEVGITADTPENVAQVYLGLNAIYLRALANLENIRLTAVNAIESADNAAIINTALSTFNSSLETLIS